MNLTRLQELSGLMVPTQVQEADEKKPATSDFHSVLDFVNDSLADLHDSIGAGGTLSKLTKSDKMAAISKAYAAFKKDLESKLTDIEVDLMADEAGVQEDVQQNSGNNAAAAADLNKPVWVIRVANGQKQQLKAHLHASDEVGDTVSLDDKPDGKIVIKKTVQGQGKMYTITARTVTEGKRINEAKDYDDSGDFTDELFVVSDHINKVKQIARQPRWNNWMQVTDDNFSTSCVALNNDFIEKLKELDTAFDALENELHSAS
jgi:hypothetical protein